MILIWQTSLKPLVLLINRRLPIAWAPTWAMMGAGAAIALFLCCDHHGAPTRTSQLYWC